MPDKIVRIDVYSLSAPVPTFSDARHEIASREAMWIRITTQDGIEGWGEAAVWGGPAAVTATILLEELFPLIKGENPNAIHYLWELMYQRTFQHGRRGAVVAAMGSIDIALWDILSKRAGLPLVDLLGRYDGKVVPYASAGFYALGKDLEALKDEYQKLRNIGFRAFKMKVGRQQRNWTRVWPRDDTYTLEQDIERVYAVRDAIGSESILLIDANTEWDTVMSTRFLRAIEDADPFFMEEPVSPDFPHQAQEIRARTNTRLAGFETEYGRFAYRDLISLGAVDVVQPDPCWCGGLSEARRIAAIASAWGRLCVPHSISSAMSFLVSAHFVGSLENGFLVEWDATGNPWMDQVVSFNDIEEDGTYSIPVGHGIGFDLDPENLEGQVSLQSR